MASKKRKKIVIKIKDTSNKTDTLKQDIAVLSKKVQGIENPKERAEAAKKLLKIIDTVETIEDPKKLAKLVKDVEAYRRLNNL